MTDWTIDFAGLARLEAPVRETLLQKSAIVAMPAGSVIFGPGKPPEHLMLLLAGRVRVQQVSETGREIVLYRVEAGQSCVMTTACLLAYQDYAAEGIAETDLRAAAVPRPIFDELIARSGTFRSFIFTAYAKRITDLFMVIEEIAFQRLDIRLAQKLLDLARGDALLAVTHQQLAAELGTAREVVSRQLGEFQRRGWVGQGRGALDLIDRAGLERLAATDRDHPRD